MFIKFCSTAGCFFCTGPPLKSSKNKKLIQARLGVSGTIYGNVDSPNLGFIYFKFLGGPVKIKKTPCIVTITIFENSSNIISEREKLSALDICEVTG